MDSNDIEPFPAYIDPFENPDSYSPNLNPWDYTETYPFDLQTPKDSPYTPFAQDFEVHPASTLQTILVAPRRTAPPSALPSNSPRVLETTPASAESPPNRDSSSGNLPALNVRAEVLYRGLGYVGLCLQAVWYGVRECVNGICCDII